MLVLRKVMYRYCAAITTQLKSITAMEFTKTRESILVKKNYWHFIIRILSNKKQIIRIKTKLPRFLGIFYLQQQQN